MNDRVERIRRALEGVEQALRALSEAGEGVPAVERNVIRMRGTLGVLRAQFDELARVLGGREG